MTGYTLPEICRSDLLIRMTYKIANQHVRAVALGIRSDYTLADLFSQYEAQFGACAYCEYQLEDIWVMEHVIPVSRKNITSGNTASNIVCACTTCNMQKMRQTPSEWKNRWYLA